MIDFVIDASAVVELCTGPSPDQELRRTTLTAYDASYVAPAERFDVPLLTCDAKLGGSNGHRAEIVVYPRS